MICSVARFLLVFACFFTCSQTWLVAEQPNVIFILTDDLGFGDLGVLHQNQSKHSKRHQTPFLDQMAADGILMPSHYCPAPVCAPSRASLLMGVHQGHSAIRDNQFDKALPDNHTLATVLKSAGYRTALIGKYGLQGKNGRSASTWPAYPTKRGFDEFFGYVAHRDGHVHYPADDWPMGNSAIHRTGKEVWWNENEVSSTLQKCYTTDLFTARSKQWIMDHQKQSPDQPFFLMLAYDTPHAALQVPTMAYPDGTGIHGGLQWIGESGSMINTATGTIDSFRHPDYVNQGWSDTEERFATMVRRIDDCVGDLLATLRELKIDDNTLVVFTSDNGPHHESYINKVNHEASSFQSYGPLDGTKRDTWEGGIRMPTIAWWPGKIKPNSTHGKATQFHDWMPTFAQLAGVAAPARSDGVSMANSLQGETDVAESTIYVEYRHNGKTKPYPEFKRRRTGRKRGQMQVIHAEGFKGIRVNVKSNHDPFEIYDVKSDPGERINLAGKSSAFDRLQKTMQDRVLQLRIANPTAPRPYDNVPIPAVVSPARPSEIEWSSCEGSFSYVPNVASQAIVQSGVISTGSDLGNQITIPNVGAVEYRFWVNVETAGEYEISFETPTKAFVRIHQIGLIDADYSYEAGQRKTQRIKLAAGYHPVIVTVLTNQSGISNFEFEFQPVSE